MFDKFVKRKANPVEGNCQKKVGLISE